MTNFSRRVALKSLAAATAIAKTTPANAHSMPQSPVDSIVGHWHKTHDRVFLGGDFWANPMEDWRIVNGAAECQSNGGNRNIQLISRELTNTSGTFTMSIRITRLPGQKQTDAGAGFRIGIRSDINEYRSNSFVKSGLNAGLIDGALKLGRNSQPLKIKTTEVKDVQLSLTGKPAPNEKYALTLTATNAGGDVLGSITNQFESALIPGNVAIVNNYQADSRRQKPVRGPKYRFADWSVQGDAFSEHPERMFGPILWTMYSLSDSRSDEGFVMKLSALTGPLGEKDQPAVELFVNKQGSWKSLGEANIDRDAWTATFRVPNWDEKTTTKFKVVYREVLTDGTESPSEWTGTIKANPSGRPLRLGALTCQNDYGFPYAPVADNMVKLDPDLLYFSGDQLYESHGGYGLIREPADRAILNYLRKYYMFGWAFREAMRDRPTVCLADDHDVFQGNIWGEGGKAMDIASAGASSNGGYREPARMVNVVHKTNTAHHPDFFDPSPCAQNISVYYGDMVYGDVSFAILGDRQWKSGPQNVDTGSGRADHVKDKDFDTSVLDKPGLVLLGERQETFLKSWAADWRGHSMKVLLSQTVFAGVATHHGGYNGYLKADLDSGGWPQTARNNAIRIIREAKCLHINGDQHLTTLCQYGVDKQRDGNWSFCTPAISAGYPRWWRPDELGMPHENRPKHGLDNTGEYLDGLGNRVYVYAVGNPEVGREKNRYKRAHQKGSGFGLVTIDTAAKTYRLEAFRFLIDATDGKPTNTFPGWPVTIHQAENAGENRIG